MKESTITTPRVRELLDALYADAARNDPLVRQAVSGGDETGFYKSMRKAYMAVGREFGTLLYGLARIAKAETVVEFGTSFGVSTIFLAAAVRDNGGCRVITTEFDADKAERARGNLAAAGLEEWVEFRIGDALQTLVDAPREIDMIFLDGPKGLYLDVLRLLEQGLRPGGVVASDNTDREETEGFLKYLRDPANGYTSASILTQDRRRGHEVSVRN